MAIPKVTFYVQTNGTITGTIKDEAGVGIPAANFDYVFVSIYQQGDATLSLRSSDDLLDDPDFVIDASGNFTWTIRPCDTRLLDPDSVPGDSETHRIVFRFGWNSTATYALSSPFTTISGSKTVTFAHTSHGLAECDHFAVVGSDADVGGLDLDGIHVVDPSPAVNSFTFLTRTAATISETGGGTVTVYHGGNTDISEINMVTNAADPIT